MDNQELYIKIQSLKDTYGASLPREVFSQEIYDLLVAFKDMQVKENWIDDCLIWAAANIDRYNGHTFGT